VRSTLKRIKPWSLGALLDERKNAPVLPRLGDGRIEEDEPQTNAARA
jgi:hypothetical protein